MTLFSLILHSSEPLFTDIVADMCDITTNPYTEADQESSAPALHFLNAFIIAAADKLKAEKNKLSDYQAFYIVLL